jgi:hypothetical protein
LDKKLKIFDPCYSQSPPPADFTPPYGFLGLENSTATAESGPGLGFVLHISLFTFNRSIGLSLLTPYFFMQKSSPYRNHNKKCIERRKPRQKTTPPLWFYESIQKKQSMKKTQLCQ